MSCLPRAHDVATEAKPTEIAVVGIGCWYPGARNPKELWENILGRRRQFRRMPDVRLPLAEYHHPDKRVSDKTYGARAAVIDGYDFDWAGHRIPKSTYESMDIAHWLALDVALQMLEDAGLKAADLPQRTTQVVVGNTLTGEHMRSNTLRLRWPFVSKMLHATALRLGMSPDAVRTLSENMERSFKSVFAPVTEDSLAGGLANTIAGRICNYLNLNGGGFTVDGACASSLLAVYSAAAGLASGAVDFAIAGGVDISLDPFELIGFAKVGALTQNDMSVYDKRGNGFIPGEGCGFVGLKRLADARRDGNKIYAILDGLGMSSDGKGGLTAPSVDGQAIALGRAYEQAGIDPRVIDFIEGHGTGTAVGDRTELLAITKALGQKGDAGRRRCGVTSFKSVSGHTKAAAGVGALIKAVIAVNQRVVPPTAGCALPHDVFSGDSRSLYPVLRGAVHAPTKELRAGVSAMGFGGINVHVTLRSGELPFEQLRPDVGERAAMASNQDSEVLCLAAASPAELIEGAERLRSDAAGASLAELTDLAAGVNSKSDARLPFRVAIVARSPEELAQRLGALIERLRTPLQAREAFFDRKNGVALGHGLDACCFGFVFPGQGSQKLNAARALVERFAWARARLDDADRWAAELGTEGLARTLYPDADRLVSKDEEEQASLRLRETQWAQPAIVLTSILWLEYLERLGISGAGAMGHSLGELTAFHAAGAFDDKALIQLATLRGQLMAGSERAPSGGMISLACDRRRAESMMAELCGEGTLVVANVNSPSQTVLSGDLAAIEAIHLLATKQGVVAHRLPVSNAFHSPLVAEASARLRELSRIPRSAARIDGALISSCDGRRIPADVDLREHFAAQIVKPVDFVRAVESLSEHCDVVVEVGPGGVLSNLIAQARDGRSLSAWPVERSAESFEDLNWLVGMAHVHGTPIAWQELYAHRILRPFVPAKDLSFIVNPCERPFDAGGAFMTSLAAEVPKEPAGHVEIPVAHPVIEPPAAGGGAAVPPAYQVLLDGAAKLTGLSPSQLDPELRLLDDLNLDSIKVSSLIEEASASLGVQGQLDPAAWANATLGRIAQELHGVMEANRAPTTVATGSRASAEENALDPAAPHTGSVAPKSAAADWVRTFDVRLVPSAFEGTPGPAPDYRGRAVAIQCDPEDQESAAALGQRLTALGARVSILDAAALLSTGRTDIDHIVIVLPRSAVEGAPSTALLARSIARLRAAAVASARQAGCASLTYVQFGGVAEGRDATPGSFATSCASSFAASLHLERPGLRVRVIDFHPTAEVEFVAGRVMDEQVGSEAYVFTHHGRSGQRYLLEPRLVEAQLLPARALAWDPRDVVVVTGGAKGITAECAFAFAKVTGARMMLLGSSPPGQAGGEIQQTLARYAQAGLFARYHQCDIVDAGAVHRTFAEIATQFGPITGVVHGAGLNRPRRVEQVEERDALGEVSPKLLGILNILEALHAAPPKLVAGISSIIGITGMPGNAWYAFSNEALNVVLQRFRASHPATETIALAYSVWAEVGMGARMGSTTHLARMGVSAIPPEAGVAHFLHAVLRQAPAPQVVIAGRLRGLDTWRRPAPASPAADRFLQDVREIEPGIELLARTRLTLDDDLYLRDHYYRGVYLFPTVFGLEAMAQAVAKVLGLPALGSLKIVDIKLTRPIVVDGGKGAGIQIRAEVLERKTASDPISVRVGIGTEQTAFHRDHFSATFVLEEQRLDAEIAKAVSLPASALDLDPGTELYGGLLFQGPMFQRLDRVWSMSSSGSVSTIQRSRQGTYFSAGLSQETILGDPCCRDVLLQSAQLSVKGILLPIGIDALHVYAPGRAGSDTVIARTVVTGRNTDGLICDVTAIAREDHRPAEQLRGYRLKQMEHDPAAPEPEDWADPSRRDEGIFASTVAASFERLGVLAPARSLTFLPELSRQDRSNRRVRECSLLVNVASSALASSGDRATGKLEVQWRDDGKPVVRGWADRSLDLSLSHDRSHCLCVAGRGPQGCDIEPIQARSRPEWLRLIGVGREALLEALIEGGDTLDEAGTRIWSTLEAVLKALGAGRADLAILRRSERSVLLSGTTERGAVRVVTVPLSLTRPPAKMLAMTAVPAAEPEAARPAAQSELHSRFRVTFKEVTTSLHGVQFDTFADWMGRIRELAIVGIGPELVADFASGKWGMVTNHSNIRIVGKVGCFDLIDGRMRVKRAYGRFGSSIDLQFEWARIDEDGEARTVAFSDMTTTWVEILDHGLVEVRPFPGYMQRLIDAYLAADRRATDAAANDVAEPIEREIPARSRRLGEALYLAPGAPKMERELSRITIETSSAESNLVGNIYYANYYHWQSRLLDRIFRGLGDDGKRARRGELTCLHSSVSHLREAMPFDRIEVVAGLQGLYRRGVELRFDFHRIGDDGKRVKLAVGKYEAVFTDAATGAPSDLPSTYLSSLTDRVPVAV
ncbi:MAG: SDR family NAD(P)-dependent oxidoreductase [Minicystis sp.]